MEASELDALITASIGDLEAAFARVAEKIDPQINAEAWSALKRSLADDEFHFDDDDDPNDSWFAPSSWLNEEVDTPQYFRLNCRDGSGFHTWLGCYVAPASEQDAIGIQWQYENIYMRDYKIILAAHTEDLKMIEEAGFRRDGNSIYLPISFDPAALSEGMREGSFREALAPIASAADALRKALPAFQRIRDAMQEKASA